MPQGLRGRTGVATVGLGVVLCAGLAGCTNTDSNPKKAANTLPTARQTQVGVGSPPGNMGATTPGATYNGTATGANQPANRQFGTGSNPPPVNGFQPAAGGMSGAPNPNNYGTVSTPTRPGNAASMSPTSGFVPGVGPNTGAQPGAFHLPQSMGSPPTGGMVPAAVPNQPVSMTASYHKNEPAAPASFDVPTPPPPPGLPTGPISPAGGNSLPPLGPINP